MRESGKRFGVNDVTKRRNSFNDKGGNKKFKKDIIIRTTRMMKRKNLMKNLKK